MHRIKTINELKKSIKDKKKLIWNDPDPIKENNYTISWIEDGLDSLDELDPILIQYNNGGSEAQVFLHEILIEN